MIEEDDTCIEKEGANLVIDSLSLQYLQGSTVDYIEDLTGSKFIISNPMPQLLVDVVSPFLFKGIIYSSKKNYFGNLCHPKFSIF